MSDVTGRKRQGKGTPTGGQFAAENKSESEVDLGGDVSFDYGQHRQACQEVAQEFGPNVRVIDVEGKPYVQTQFGAAHVLTEGEEGVSPDDVGSWKFESNTGKGEHIAGAGIDSSPKGVAHWLREQNEHSRITVPGETSIKMPFKEGDQITIPKGTIVEHRGSLRRTKRDSKIKVSWSSNGQVDTGFHEPRYAGKVRLPTVTWAGSGGYWSTCQLTQNVCEANGVDRPMVPGSAQYEIERYGFDPQYGKGYDNDWEHRDKTVE